MKDFIIFWNHLVLNPFSFFKNDFNREKSPYFLFVLLTYGIADQITRMDKQLMKIANGRQDVIGLSDNWIMYLALVVVLGIFSGYMFYYLGGWWFNFRIGICGGVKDIKSSRFIFLYSTFPYALFTILAFIPTITKYETPLDAYLTESLIGDFYVMASIFLLFYSLKIKYNGAHAIFNLNSLKTKFWFIVVPSIYYITVFILIGIVFAKLNLK